jgi:hypothetical protein
MREDLPMNRSWRAILAAVSEAAGYVGGLLILLAVTAWRELLDQMDEDDTTPGRGL